MIPSYHHRLVCVFEVKQGGGLILTELHSVGPVENISAKTGAPFEVALNG